MNSFVRAGVPPVILLSCVLGCRTTAPQPKARLTGNVTHVVICRLKEPGNVDARTRLVNASKSFEKIPGVLSVRTGTPVPSTRPVVDSTYDLAVVMTFDSRDSLRRYDSHPIHAEAVKSVLRPLVSKFVIYDFEDTINP